MLLTIQPILVKCVKMCFDYLQESSIPSILNSISDDNVSDEDDDDDNDREQIELPSLRRRGLLPPIQLSPQTDNMFLPGKKYSSLFLILSLTPSPILLSLSL